MTIPWIPHWKWNRDAVDRVIAGTPLPGAHIRLRQLTGGGTMMSLDAATGWQHPWFTTPSWDSELEKWRVRIRPGFVNGIDPVIKRYGPDGEDVGLLENPALTLNSFRRLGKDAAPISVDPQTGRQFFARIPPFFEALGVQNPSGNSLVGAISGTPEVIEPEPSAESPLLRAVDIELAISRLALSAVITPVDATGVSGLVVDYSLNFDATTVEREGVRPRIRLTREYEEFQPPTFEQRILGTFPDETEDRRHIATVYLLSPPETPHGAEPDASWTPYVQHHTFWNLDHAPKNEVPPAKPPPIRIQTGLLARIGDAISNQILSTVNELTDRVFNAINNTDNAGRFWTS